MAQVSLLDQTIAAHGGSERWEQVAEVRLRLRVGGNIIATKFKSPRTRSLECVVDRRRVHAVLKPFPREGLIGIFEGDRMRIETAEGTVIAQRDVLRDPSGRVLRRVMWDDLDLLYFLGYALWNYTLTPYLFRWPGFLCSEGETVHEPDGSALRTLHVLYPVGFPTHCREQTFYFDERGLLRRLDYTAEVFSDFARGVHLCEDHREFGGLIFPTHRIVYPRSPSGKPMRFITAMEGWVEDVVLSY